MKKLILSIQTIVLFLSISLIVNAQETSPFSFVTTGQQNAPLHMFEFTSLSCIHCRTYNKEIQTLLQRDYISKGRLKVTYIDMPFGSTQNLIAHALLHKVKNFIEYKQLFNIYINNQNEWANSPNGVQIVKRYAKTFGIPENVVNSIEQDTEFLNAMLTQSMELAKSLKVQGTPTIIIVPTGQIPDENSLKFSGVPNYSKLDEALKKMLPANINDGSLKLN